MELTHKIHSCFTGWLDDISIRDQRMCTTSAHMGFMQSAIHDKILYMKWYDETEPVNAIYCSVQETENGVKNCG